ncbi:MAG TPA: gamma-glutamyltransferase [Gemmatimonadaceae bacterium]|nr:gamma-glutamyltransferase [Gemmatimonadaceae bacterium]
MRVHPLVARIVPLALAALAACHPAANAPGHAVPPRAAATFPSTWRFQSGRTAVTAPHAMVASNSALASEAGVEIMREGGNAVDAAVATGFALAVTYPRAGNIGGGGFMVIRMADGRVAALDYREIAPLAATRDMYVDPNGKLTDASVVGPLASGVPGAVAGMAEALRRYGTMSLAQVMRPAIRMAAEGFVVDSALALSVHADSALISRFEGKSVFLPGGKPLQAGTRLVQPALAHTLRLIAEQGPKAFYEGEIADSIAAEMQRDGGIITKADLARYRPEWREPIRGSYRGDSVFAMPPSSSGGITTMESLNILETFPTLPPFGSAAYAHVVAEAFRRAFIDRNTELGDPAFVRMPVDKLTSKAYARTLAATIQPARATPSPAFTSASSEPVHTTHYSVVDAKGNAVATTTTINSLYGSGVFVRGAGFFLNDEMDDFASQPGQPNQFGLVQGEANAIAPGKRMLSAMSPTIVVGADGKLLLVVGAAGGPTIITSTTQVILNVVDHHMSLADAMAAPRLHEQTWPDVLYYERGGLTSAAMDSLRAMGYELRERGAIANANAVMRVAGGWAGVVEPRSSGGAVGF